MPIIGSGQMTLIDMNDVLVSATKPSNPAEGQMWWNTTESQLYVYQGGQWQQSTQVISGGRNLLRNSGLFKSTNGWSLNGGTGLVVDTTTFAGESVLSATGSIKAVASVPVKNGQEYVYATEIMFNQDIALNSTSPLHYWVNLTGVNGTAGIERASVDGGDRTLVANKWHKIVIRFKVKDDGISYVFTPFIYRNPMPQKWWMRTIQLMEGNVPTGWSPAPEEIDEVITDVTETLGNMANDGVLDYNERQIIKDKLTSLTGMIVPDGNTALPDIGYIDAETNTAKGLVYTVRKQAQQIGISASHTKYVAVATKYTALKTYLDAMTPVKPWDVSVANQKKIINVTKNTFRDTWLQVYLAVDDLATYTSQVQNDDAYNPVKVNHASNGNFEIPLDEGLWKNSYVGQTKERVDISAESAPFQWAYHVKNTTNANGGIFTQELWSGTNAEVLVDKEITVQFWLKYQNIVAGAQSYLAGRFGELLIEGENASAQKFYRYIRFANTTTMNEGSYITGTDMTWKKYTGTTKLTLPTGATKITRVSFKHGLEGCTGEFWSTGIKIEFGAKASDWSVAPIDLQQKVYKTALAVEPNNITATVVSNQTFINTIDKVVSNETGYINKNYNFADWTGTYPVGYNGNVGTAVTKVTPSETGNGKSVRFTNALGVESYLSGDGYLDKPYYQYVYVESTFKLESGSINGAGILFRYLRADNSSSAFEGRFKFSDVVASPTLNKWYTVSTVFKVPVPTDFGGYRLYTMGSYGAFDATKPAKSILIDSTISRPATAEEAKAYEANIAVNDMTNDNKLTALEKHALRNQLDMIITEKPTLEAKANQYLITTEKDAYVTAYNTLITNLDSVTSGVNLNLTSDINGANVRTWFKSYNDKKEILEKTILDAVNFSGRNLIFNSKMNKTEGNVLLDWTNISSGFTVIEPEADKPDSSIWTASRTGLGANSILSASSNRFNATMGDVFVFAIDLKVTDVTAWDVQNPFIVEFYNAKTGGTRVQFEDITMARLGKTLTTADNNKWMRVYCLVKVTNATVVSGLIRVGLFRNGNIFIREVKVEKGTRVTDFSVAPEDVDAMIYNIETRMSSAEIKISDSSIINTIRQSTDYKNDLSAKADNSDLANLATKGEVDNANKDAKNYADDKVKNIDFEPFVLKTQLSQEITNISAKFEAGGGVNLLKNSVGYGVLTATAQDSYVPAWTLVNPTGVQTVSSSALDALGFGRGFQLPPSTVTTEMKQDVYVQVGQPYTLSWYINKTNNTATTDGAVYVEFLQGATILNAYTTTYAGNYVTNGFEKDTITIIPTAGVVTVRVRANKSSDIIISGFMFNIGAVPLQWSLATGELYNTNIRMDMNGIKVSQIVNGVERGYTQITPQEFAGYYDSKGDGKYEKVFYLKEDETVSKKFVAKEEFTLGSIKIIKVESTANKGWAFVQVVPTT